MPPGYTDTMNALRRMIFLILMAASLCPLHAQSVDPTLAAMIALYTEKAERTLQSEQQAMLLETAGHVWTRAELDGTYRLLKEFNDYLDGFRGVVVYAAQAYGFCHEVERLIGNMESLTRQIERSPGGAVAVALSSGRNRIYRDVILQGAAIVGDIRTVCLSDVKMTERERLELLLGVRPKLRAMNQKLLRLIRAVRYTSLGDVWYELSGRSRDGADVGAISASAFERWRGFGKSIRP